MRERRGEWLSPRDLEAPGMRLFCLPHAGSGAAGFYRWKRLLPASIAVCPVLLPGREGRLAEPALSSMGALADELLEHVSLEPGRPYAVFGHSMGSLLGYEWLRRVAADELPKPLCFFASGRDAPQVLAVHAGLHRLPPVELVGELKRRYGGEPEALLDDPELSELFLPILRSDLQAVESYAWASFLPLKCEIWAIAGERDRSVSDGGLGAWKELTEAGCGCRRFMGDHFYHFGEGQGELLRFIAESLEKLSSAIQSKSLQGEQAAGGHDPLRASS